MLFLSSYSKNFSEKYARSPTKHQKHQIHVLPVTATVYIAPASDINEFQVQ